MKKRLLAGLLTVIMVMTMIPVTALAANSTALNPGDVQAAKGIVSQTPDADGNYTIQLSVKGGFERFCGGRGTGRRQLRLHGKQRGRTVQRYEKRH